MKIKRSYCIAVKQKKVSNNNIAYLSIMLYYIWQICNLFAQKCFGSGTLLYNAVYLILAAAVAGTLVSAIRKKPAYCILVELMVLFFYTVSYILGYADKSVLGYNFVWTFAICVPLGLSILCMDDLGKLYNLLYRMAKPMVGVLCGLFFLDFIILKTSVRYDAPMSYALIFWCIILCNAILEKVKLSDFLCLLVGLGFTLLWGSRGTYLCFALFVLLKIVFDVDAKRQKTLIFLGGGGRFYLH